MTDILNKNLIYLEQKMPSAFKAIKETFPQSKLVANEQGQLNVENIDGSKCYVVDAKRETEHRLNLFFKQPVKLLIGRPAISTGKFVEPEPKFNDEWATNKYDDRPEDHHYARYVDALSKELIEKNKLPSDKLFFQRNTIYLVVYGLGLGFHVKQLIEKYKPSFLIILDTSRDNLVHSASVCDWEDIIKISEESKTKIKMFFDKDPYKLHEFVKGTITANSLCGLDGLISYIGYEQPELKLAQQMLMDPKTGNLASFMGFITDEYNMMKNSFRNLRHGTKRMIGRAENKLRLPVLIVGSGPSLENSIEELKKHTNKFVLISSGSSLKILLQNGIKPDFHCNLERASSILERHQELIDLGFDLKDIYAVMASSIWPGVDSFFKDTVYFLRPALSPLGVFAENYDQVLFNEGPQVTNTAFAFSRRLAVKEIYLLGVDLGTTDKANPRSVGAWKGQRERKLTIPIRGNKGKTVYTDMALLQQRDTLEAQIAKLREVGGNCYNLGDGAYIKGSTSINFDGIDSSVTALQIDEKKKIVDEALKQFPVYSRKVFEHQWTNAIVREAIGRFCDEIRGVISGEGWANDIVNKVEEICSYNNKAIRKQYPPRLLRGSLLRILIHAHGCVQRFNPDDYDEGVQIIKDHLINLLNLLEMEAYALADELESEDGRLFA